MLDYSHDALLVAAAFAVALMAGFTGLSLTRGASKLPYGQRKLVVAMAAVALGGGIWSLHFVAMLGLQLPVLFYYDALTTLISALVAILMAELALLLVHFGRRTKLRITAAGVIVGLGIPAMHYIGMSGMQLCRPVYTPGGIALALAASIALSIGSFWISYGEREARNILLGTLGFGVTVFAVHFIAMAGTGFLEVDVTGGTGPAISNESIAFGVTLASFLISAAFLLTGATFFEPQKTAALAAEAAAYQAPPTPLGEEASVQPLEAVQSHGENRVEEAAGEPVEEPGAPATAPVPEAAAAPDMPPMDRLPYEKDGRTHFIDVDAVAAIRASGHYTFLYCDDERLFCPWSITEVENRIPYSGFIRTHRSYLVNRRFVSGFERKKDTGVCFFEGIKSLTKVPVSRSRLGEVRDLLGV
ncbi:MAG: LytTR family transcriptional regulator DNA-binding domain-containing protein [Alphaproteobacteria bacterium]|nr:LytTR family transcriptional regulator DNA-binding domain-containing protein [Alphaproteobacteria bacterium]